MVSRRPFDEASALTEGPDDTAPVVENERVFFLRPDNGKKQVRTIPLNGGEARCVTDLAGGVEGFALSPDGGSIAAVSTVDPDAEECDEPGLPRVRVVRRVRYRHDARGYTGDAFRHLFLVDVESGSARQITDGEGDNWSPRWSPDGRSLAFISDDVEGRDFTSHTQVKVVTLPGGEPVSWSQSLPYVWAAAWSPDGESLAAIGCHDPEMWDPRSAWLYVLDAGGSVRRITDGLYTPVPECGLWWTAERGIVFIGAHRGEFFLCSIHAGRQRLQAHHGRRHATGEPLPRTASASHARPRRPIPRVAGRADAGRSRHRSREGDHLVLRAVPRPPSTCPHGEVRDSSRRLRHRVARPPPSRLRRFEEIPGGAGHPRRSERPLLRQLRPRAPGPCEQRVHRAGREPARFLDLRPGVHQSGARRLGRRGLPRHPRLSGRTGGAALRGREPHGRARVQLRRLHERLDSRPRSPLQGRGRRLDVRQPAQHVRHLRHRHQFRRAELGRACTPGRGTSSSAVRQSPVRRTCGLPCSCCTERTTCAVPSSRASSTSSRSSASARPSSSSGCRAATTPSGGPATRAWSS